MSALTKKTTEAINSAANKTPMQVNGNRTGSKLRKSIATTIPKEVNEPPRRSVEIQSFKLTQGASDTRK